MRPAGIVVAVLVAALAIVSAGAGAHPAAPPKVAIFNLTDTPKVKPRTVYLSADAGPYVTRLTWRGWGTARAVGRGTFVSDCASCGPKERRPATIVLRTLRSCPAFDVRSYRHAELTVHDPPRHRSEALPLGCPPA